jgi:hypothetical protein
MAQLFTCHEYADMHLVYGEVYQNSLAARRKYQQMFRNRRIPHIVCLNSKFPPPVELCWQNKNISQLRILNNQSWQYNYFTNIIQKH